MRDLRLSVEGPGLLSPERSLLLAESDLDA